MFARTPETIRRDERKSAALFFVYAFLLLVCYYVLKTVREPVLLAGGSAELKSYAYAATAAVLMVVVPAYGVWFRRCRPGQLIRRITVFCIGNLALFYGLGRAGADIGFAYYVWVGVFGVLIVAQFWAHAAHSYQVESGQRLFPVIMAGAALGALVGPRLGSVLFPLLGPWNLMLLAIPLLAATLPLVERSAAAVPQGSRHAHAPAEPRSPTVLGGFGLVLRDRHLLLLAALAVLLNCVNTTGEYILTDLVIRDVDVRLAADPLLQRANLIAAFYGNYYLAVNALSLVVQVLLVAKVFRWIGVHGALLVLPVIALVGYGLVVFVPIFGIIRAVKIVENSTNYSIMNTARHALYLPLPTAHQFEGKTAIDTFFWRVGDLVQAVLIYFGSSWLGFELEQFALLNMGLACLWIAVTCKIAARHDCAVPRRRRVNAHALGVAGGAAAFAVVAFALPSDSHADDAALFRDPEPLAMELRFDARNVCRTARGGDECADLPATVTYVDDGGQERHVEAAVRVRGKWRAETGHCTLPPLFVKFDDTADTIFEGQRVVPLTTHCREDRSYEQYLLKEYLAYRAYGALTDKSLAVRLARITYVDTGRRDRRVERYAFFTEHFESLAARQSAELLRKRDFDPGEADTRELAVFGLFEYMIGNTDWSAVKGHNVIQIRDAGGTVTPVPFDFDFSGLVDADYAGPPPGLPIDSVTQRLFRGFCSARYDEAFTVFRNRRSAIMDAVEQTPGLSPGSRQKARAYLESFFDMLDSPAGREQIFKPCRAAVTAN